MTFEVACQGQSGAQHAHMHLVPTGRVYEGILSRISFVRFVILFFIYKRKISHVRDMELA